MKATLDITGEGGTIRIVDEPSWHPIVRILANLHPNAYGWIDISSDDARMMAAALNAAADNADRRHPCG